MTQQNFLEDSDREALGEALDIVETLARAAHETTDLDEYGRIMDQAHAVLTPEQYSAFFAKFLQLRDEVK